MFPDLHRAMVVVEFYIIECRRAGVPDHGAVGLLDEVVAVFSALPIAHADCKVFRTLDISAPGLQPVIRRMPAAAEPEIFMACPKLITVQHDLDIAAVARCAAEQFVLTAFAELA